MKPSRRPPSSQTAKRVAAIMHWRPSTGWLPKEIRAFRLLGDINKPRKDGDRELPPELDSIERYYRMNWPPRHGKNPLRTDLYTLLNNWTGELGRADVWNEQHPEKPKPRKIIPLPPTPSEPFIQTPEDKERTDKFMAMYRARKQHDAAKEQTA